MKRRFILYRRKLGGVFYLEDTKIHKQHSLGTKDRAEAKALLNARNESVRQPQLNRKIAQAYLAGTDSGVSTRIWMEALMVPLASPPALMSMLAGLPDGYMKRPKPSGPSSSVPCGYYC